MLTPPVARHDGGTTYIGNEHRGVERRFIGWRLRHRTQSIKHSLTTLIKKFISNDITSDDATGTVFEDGKAD